MTTKFEQLIEYVINDEQAKARELFHDIVVEKSRQIYEEMMQEEEELDEAESTEQEDEKAEKAGRKVTKDIEYDDKKDKMDEGMDEALGGDQADDLIDDVEAEEQGMAMEADDDMDMDDHHADVGGDEELEDRVVDLEDKLDELMAEFESLMGDEGGIGGEEEIDMDVDMDGGEDGIDVDMDSEEVVDDELETEGMMEAVSLKAVPAPKHGDDGANSKSPVAANSGARGAMAKPVKMTGDTAQGRPAPTAKDAIGKVGNTPAQSTQEPRPATKPTLSQASGVNTKSVIK
jgi:hypothetical protein